MKAVLAPLLLQCALLLGGCHQEVPEMSIVDMDARERNQRIWDVREAVKDGTYKIRPCALAVDLEEEKIICSEFERESDGNRVVGDELRTLLFGKSLAVGNKGVTPGHGITWETFDCDQSWHGRGTTTTQVGRYSLNEDTFCVRTKDSEWCGVVARDVSGGYRRIIKYKRGILSFDRVAPHEKANRVCTANSSSN